MKFTAHTPGHVSDFDASGRELLNIFRFITNDRENTIARSCVSFERIVSSSDNIETLQRLPGPLKVN